MLTTRDYDNFPVWSPRSDLIAFVRKIGVDFEVFTIRPDETIILPHFAEPDGECLELQQSHDEIEFSTGNTAPLRLPFNRFQPCLWIPENYPTIQP
jgi:hypothetical protein